MKILTMNLNEAMVREHYLNVPHAHIRIADPTDSLPKLPPNNFLEGILILKFYDVDSTKHTKNEDLEDGMFTTLQANEVLDFVGKMEPLIDILCCHCRAGISRSAGISAALSLIFNDSDKEIFNNKKFIPNMKVYSTILKAWEERKDIIGE